MADQRKNRAIALPFPPERGPRQTTSLDVHRQRAEEDEAALEALRTTARKSWEAEHPVAARFRTARRLAGSGRISLEVLHRSLHSFFFQVIPEPLHTPVRSVLGSMGALAGPDRGRRSWDAPVIPPRSRSFDILCLPIIRWDYRYQRPQQILSRFADEGYRVFYVSPDFAPSGETRARSPRPGVFEIGLPADREIFMVRDTLEPGEVERFADHLEAMADAAGVSDLVLLVQFPFWQPIARRLNERRGWPVVYDMMDEHSGFPFVEPDVIRLEDELIRSADSIVVTSSPLEAKVRRAGRQPVRIANGADFERFSRVPSEIVAFAPDRPVIGYIGAVSRWIDVELVGSLSRRRPDWSFVLVGSTYGSRLGPLMGRPNVHLVGEIGYPCLAPILHDFDVAIIPFLQTPLTYSTNPIKLYEYLSAGKPVVASRIPETEAFADTVYLADGVDEFETQVVRALAEDGTNLRARRMARVREHTWDARRQAFEAELAALFLPH